jgi:3-dehydroquinate dehydratase / shikimate dehydrogenase
MVNRLAVSLALPDTEATLRALDALKAAIGLAEIRLDLMREFDLERLIGESPSPLVITCRPPREGGKFAGTERERLEILARAMDVGAAYVDVEWDSVRALSDRRRSATRLIASRHWYDRMPASLWPYFVELRSQADAVKLVGLARTPLDNLPVLDLLNRADVPVIALAMGNAGQLTRLVAPCYEQCLLTYGAAGRDQATAPGQLSITDLIKTYRLDVVGSHTAIHLHLCVRDDSAQMAVAKNAYETSGRRLHVAVKISAAEAQEMAAGLTDCVPRLTLTADRELDVSEFGI